jgi:hypothetical protein
VASNPWFHAMESMEVQASYHVNACIQQNTSSKNAYETTENLRFSSFHCTNITSI